MVPWTGADKDDTTTILTSKYDGEASELRQYLTTLKAIFMAKKCTTDNERKAGILLTSVTPRVLSHLQELNDQDFINYDKLVSKLNDVFGLRINDELAAKLEQMVSLKQSPSESLRDYLNRADMLMARLAEALKQCSAQRKSILAAHHTNGTETKLGILHAITKLQGICQSLGAIQGRQANVSESQLSETTLQSSLATLTEVADDLNQIHDNVKDAPQEELDLRKWNRGLIAAFFLRQGIYNQDVQRIIVSQTEVEWDDVCKALRKQASAETSDELKSALVVAQSKVVHGTTPKQHQSWKTNNNQRSRQSSFKPHYNNHRYFNNTPGRHRNNNEHYYREHSGHSREPNGFQRRHHFERRKVQFSNNNNHHSAALAETERQLIAMTAATANTVASSAGHLLQQQVVILDPGATHSFCSREWLKQRNIQFRHFRDISPVEIKTAAAPTMARQEIIIDAILHNKWPISIQVLVLETEELIPILLGATALRNLGANIDFLNGFLSFDKTCIPFKWSKTNLLFLPFDQESQSPLKAAMSTTMNSPNEAFYHIHLKQGNTMAAIPHSQLYALLKNLHDNLGHAGIKPCHETFKRYATSSEAMRILQEITSTCNICARVKPKSGFEIKNGSLDSPNKFHTIAVDLVYYPESIEGHLYLLTIQDQWSNYIVGVPIKDRSSKTIAEAFTTAWLTPYGAPARIRADEGSEFTKEFKQLCERNNIELVLSPTGRSQSNGKLERQHRELHIVMKAEIEGRAMMKHEWPSLVPVVTTKLNRRPLKKKGSRHRLSPFELIFNEQPLLPAIFTLQQLLDQRNKKATDCKYQPGEHILFCHPKAKDIKLDKLDISWQPATISRQISDHVYEIIALNKAAKDCTWIAHVNNLRKIKHSNQQADTNSPSSEKNTFEKGHLIVWRDSETQGLYIGCIVKNLQNHLEVQAYGTYSKGPLESRKFFPGWDDPKDGKTVYQGRRPSTFVPEICEIRKSQVLQEVQLTKDKRLPEDVVLKYQNGIDNCQFKALLTQSQHFLFNIVNETTHQAINYSTLTEQEWQELQKARDKELEKIQKFEAYTVVDRSSVKERPVPTRFVDTRKLTNDGQRIFKSRLVARGDKDYRENLETTTASCPQDSIRLVLIVGMSHKYWNPNQALVVDFDNAYLQADRKTQRHQQHYVFILPPIGHPDRLAGKVWKVGKALYGFADSGNLFEKHRNRQLALIGFRKTPLEGVWMKLQHGKIQALIAAYVDDLLIVGMEQAAKDIVIDLRKVMACKDAVSLKRFIGVDYEVHQDRIILSQSNYAKQIFPHQDSVPSNPLPINVLREDDNTPVLNNIEATNFRQLLGSVAYLAYTTRPDIAFAASFLSKWNCEPTQKALKLLQQTAKYASSTANYGITLLRPHNDEFSLTAMCDASFGNSKKPNAHSGYVIFHAGRPIAWKSAMQKRVARSSTKAEVLAISDCVDHLFYFKNFLKLVWPKVTLRLFTDSADALNLLTSDFPKPAEKALYESILMLQDKTMVVPTIATLDAIDEAQIMLNKVETAHNIADGLTKPMSIQAILKTLTNLDTIHHHVLEEPSGGDTNANQPEKNQLSSKYSLQNSDSKPSPTEVTLVKYSGPTTRIRSGALLKRSYV